MSTRAEQITSEVKRLVLRCRQLEADLAVSVPKKVLEDTVAKMQQKLDAMNTELKRTRTDLEISMATNERLDIFAKQLALQNEQAAAQNESIKSLAATLVTMIPSSIYDQATLKIRELEQNAETKSKEHSALQLEKADLEQKISGMVPREQYTAIQNQLAESVPQTKYNMDIQRIRGETVPLEEYSRTEARIAELERELANSVPKSEFEELSETIVLLTKSAPILDGDVPTSVTDSSQIISEPGTTKTIAAN